ncbi:MAG TPA: hypothetical protein DCS43_15385 [Verrucomicrobia bacterium]|nr:hypothetical protein [Verrucomicrobiota bacterium]
MLAGRKTLVAGALGGLVGLCLFFLTRMVVHDQPASEPLPPVLNPLASAGCPIAFDPASVDFGVRYASETISQSVSLRNVSDKPVRITDVSRTCGCATAALTADTLAPGEAVTLGFKVVLEGRTGAQRMAIHVQADGAAFLSLVITGTVQEDLRLTPSRLALMQVGTEGRLEASFTVAAMDGVAFTISSIRGVPEGITVGVETNDGAYRVTLSCDAEMATEQDGKLTLQTDHPWRPLLHIPFVIKNVSEIVSRPASIDLSISKSGKAQLTIFSPAAIPFDIVRVDAPPGVTATPQRLAPHVYRVALELSDMQAVREGQVLRVQSSTGARLEIPVQAPPVLRNQS